MRAGDIKARPYDEIVETYNLTILTEMGDWSLDGTGDLVTTKDGDPQHGDIAYNGLFRLVQMWRYSEAHLRYLFATVDEMQSQRRALDDDLNAVGNKAHEEIMRGHRMPSGAFGAALHDVWDRQAAAVFGAGIYAGSLMLMLSTVLLRLRDDIEGKRYWSMMGPSVSGHSIGAIIEAGANGFRHADEWAKTHPPTPQQKRSQDIIAAALSERREPDEGSPGACVELLAVLSGGTFEGLATNVFTFAHNLAVRCRQAP
ncbi:MULTISPECIES: hypothetical protein [Bradyrhizobium]|uniref:hypothetical protein n=1 Tax=Bradyrhizobium TaxID=374 RepID=UPI00047F2B5F|nr:MULTISPECIES: hypothetical protein [Bradyrhizobium]QOG22254.1 hypothetical protein FOM02_38160 [Bradyrhizobium sp. SEMIA]UFW50026.1 hypothetical protein BaraCB756_02765 [Bradyrhizobium arachidis]